MYVQCTCMNVCVCMFVQVVGVQFALDLNSGFYGGKQTILSL